MLAVLERLGSLGPCLRRRLLALAMVLAVTTGGAAPVPQQPSGAGAAGPAPAGSSRGSPESRRAAEIANTAAEVRGTLPVEQALLEVTMPAASARRAGEALAELGFETALDLELIGGGESGGGGACGAEDGRDARGRQGEGAAAGRGP
eukprot:SAG31_NODE_2133_length_6372_cov_4.372071_5_plen_148_part_00